MNEYIKCCECNSEIPRNRIISQGRIIGNEEILCSKCLKKNYGDELYEMVKQTINNRSNTAPR